MMSDMTNDTRDMLGNIHDKLQKQRSADIAETRDMLGGIRDNFQSQINAVISTVEADAGKRSTDMAEMRGTIHEMQAQIDVVISDARTEAGQRSFDIAKCTRQRAKHVIS